MQCSVLGEERKTVRMMGSALAIWLSLLELGSMRPSIAGYIPHQGTRLGCSQGAYGRQPVDVSLSHQCFSLSLSLSTPLPLSPLPFLSI